MMTSAVMPTPIYDVKKHECYNYSNQKYNGQGCEFSSMAMTTTHVETAVTPAAVTLAAVTLLFATFRTFRTCGTFVFFART